MHEVGFKIDNNVHDTFISDNAPLDPFKPNIILQLYNNNKINNK